MANGTCAHPGGCDGAVRRRGWCGAHYERWRITGDLGPAYVRRVPQGTDLERFMAYVDDSSGPSACHPWRGPVSTSNYGRFSSGDVTYQATRWLLGYLRGRPLTSDEEACHTCDNPPCVNPAHLYVGDHPRNMRDMAERGRARWQKAQAIGAHKRAAKTHCKHGHEFTTENTYIIQATGSRSCKTCQRRWKREWRERQRALRSGALRQ